jgi:hypothetical protein
MRIGEYLPKFGVALVKMLINSTCHCEYFTADQDL